MAPEEDPCAGATHGPGDVAIVCICYVAHVLCSPCTRPRTAPQRKQSVRRTPQPIAAGDHLARRPPCIRVGLDAVWEACAQHTVTQVHRPTATRYTPCRLSARNQMPGRIIGGPGPQADRLTGTGLGDVAVRLRRASLRPGPATADGFVRLRLRRQAPDIPGRWSRATGTWHMTPRDSPWGGMSHPHRRG
jgi:hypothetical protein